MPTGYTSDIYSGKEVSGKEFLMQCARAFGACITLRDEPMDAEIPEEFKPNDYHLKQIQKAKDELKKYQQMNNEDIKSAIDKEHREKITYNKEQLKNYSNMKNRYLNTLSEVLVWQPPTDQHIGLKEFAVQQLKDSIKHDCDGIEKYYSLDVKKETPEEYIKRNIEKCLKDIDYHSKEHQKEIDRTNGRTQWVKDLRNSLQLL